MRLRVWVTATVLLATSIGLAALATAAENATTPPPSPQWLVPAGNVADSAVYSRSTTWSDGTVETDEITLRIVGVTQTLDHAGRPRATLELEESGQIRDADGVRTTRTLFIDLATHDVVQVKTHVLIPGGTWETSTAFGPDIAMYPHEAGTIDGPYTSMRASQDFWLRFAGTTVRLGDDLSSWRAPQIAATIPWFGTARTSAEFSSKVDRVGTFREEPVLRVTETWNVAEPDVQFEERSGATYWFSASIPFPVHVTERRSSYEWWGLRHESTSTWSLIGWEPGTVPIPWEAASSEPASPASPPTTATWGLPETGTSRLPIPLRKATRLVEEDPSLVGFTVWRAQTPGWKLVGADLRKGAALGANDAPGYVWILTYAAPGADLGYRIQSNYANADAAPVHQDSFALRLTGTARDLRLPATIPASRLTLEDVDDWWSRVGNPTVTSLPPDRLAWGYAWVRDCEPTPIERTGCAPFDPEFMMRYLHYGSNQGVYPPIPLQNPVGYEYDLLDIDLHEARLLHHFGLEDRGNVHVAAIQLDPVSQDPQAANPATVTDNDGAVFAAVASTSFLLLLLIYAYPTLKALAGRVLVIPGFTRLDVPKVIEHRHRSILLDLVLAEPGINAKIMAQRLPELGWRTLIYHLGVLERHGLIESMNDGRRRRFFPKSTNNAEKVAVATLKNQRTREVYDLVQRAGGVTRTELARHLDISIPSVLWHLDRLERAALIRHTKQDGRVHYRHAGNPPPPA